MKLLSSIGFVFIMLLLGVTYLDMNQLNAQNISVINEEAETLNYPWAGGLNSVQFGEIDLNRDGLMDLFLFDRHGNRKLCFLNKGVYNKVSYSFRPEYSDLLPDLFDWAIFTDYNGDGKNDIFTFSPGWAGMKVYKNISENVLEFELVVDPYLKSLQGEMYLNLLVTEVDYPGIADIDNDGDLDILSFWGLGSFVNYHRNMSMEKYGHADSLDYKLDEYCWGLFAESEESNKIYLDTCFDQKIIIPDNDNQTRHKGSTFLLLDLDKDTILDLLLGDVDFPGIIALNNDGSRYNAHIGSYDTLFPASSNKIELFSFPVAAYIDVDNDGIKDLLVSSFDSQLVTSENKNSVWYYKNTGGNNKPFFNLESKNFLQSEMIDNGSGAYPVLFDWDMDGLFDLFIGNYGFYQYSYYDNFNLVSVFSSKIGYYKNTGVIGAPEFKFMDEDFAGLSALNQLGFVPAFGDIDGDEDIDLLSGNEHGQIILAVNQDGNFEISDTNYFSIDVGDFSTPQLFDLDKDGLLDLIIGEQSGNLNYYRNAGTEQSPVFEFVTDSLGKVRVTDIPNPFYGYSVPCFFRDESDVTHLVVGSEVGNIFYYTNIDDNLDGAFTMSDNLDELLDTTNISFDRGTRTAAAIADISGNDKLEMLAGNFSGGLEYFNGNATVSPGFTDQKNKRSALRLHPNPASNRVLIILPENNVVVNQIQVFDLNGRIVLQKINPSPKDGFYQIDLKNFTSGFYFVKIGSDLGILTGRFIKTNLQK